MGFGGDQNTGHAGNGHGGQWAGNDNNNNNRGGEHFSNGPQWTDQNKEAENHGPVETGNDGKFKHEKHQNGDDSSREDRGKLNGDLSPDTEVITVIPTTSDPSPPPHPTATTAAVPPPPVETVPPFAPPSAGEITPESPMLTSSSESPRAPSVKPTPEQFSSSTVPASIDDKDFTVELPRGAPGTKEAEATSNSSGNEGQSDAISVPPATDPTTIDASDAASNSRR